MSQRSTLRAIDAEMFAAFRAEGAADSAVHRTRDGVETAITVLYDDAPLETYTDGIVTAAGQRRELTILAGEVAAVVGDTVTITETGEAFTLQSEIDQDDSASRWVVRPLRSPLT